MEKKTAIYKVNYKGLVRELGKTKRELRKIKNKVGDKQKISIAQQIKSIDYLEAVCKSTSVGVTLAGVKPKMSGCKLVAVKMSKFYSAA